MDQLFEIFDSLKMMMPHEPRFWGHKPPKRSKQLTVLSMSGLVFIIKPAAQSELFNGLRLPWQN